MKLLTALLLLTIHQSALAIDLSNTIFEKVGKESSIDPKLLYAIALVESGSAVSKLSTSPTLYALRADKAFYASDYNVAKKKLSELLNDNQHVDIGMMQVNTRYHSDKVLHVEQLLDPLTNLRVAAQIININLRSTSNFKLGIGRYHSWGTTRANDYAEKVFIVYSQL